MVYYVARFRIKNCNVLGREKTDKRPVPLLICYAMVSLDKKINAN